MFERLYNRENKKWFPKFFYDDTPEKDDVKDPTELKPQTREEVAEAEKSKKNSEMNRKIADKIFMMFEKNGLVAENKEFGDGYFVFNMGDNSVVHFNFKGYFLRDFKVGMWIHSEYLENPEKCDSRPEKKYPTVEIFAQYSEHIDKFKPSASSICFDVFDEDVKRLMEMSDDELGDLIKLPFDFWKAVRCFRFMKRHPLMAYSGLCGHKAFECGITRGVFTDFVVERTKANVTRVAKKVLRSLSFRYHMIRLRLLTLSGLVEQIDVIDWNAKNQNLGTSYNYEVWICLTHSATDDVAHRFLSRWFPLNGFGYTGGHFNDHRFEIQEVKRLDMEGGNGDFVSSLHFRSNKAALKSIRDRIHFYGMSGFKYEKRNFVDYCAGWGLKYDGDRTFLVRQVVDNFRTTWDDKTEELGSSDFFTSVVISNDERDTIHRKMRDYEEYKKSEPAEEVKSEEDK